MTIQLNRPTKEKMPIFAARRHATQSDIRRTVVKVLTNAMYAVLYTSHYRQLAFLVPTPRVLHENGQEHSAECNEYGRSRQSIREHGKLTLFGTGIKKNMANIRHRIISNQTRSRIPTLKTETDIEN